MPGHGVARILDDAQVRDHILDVRRLDEPEAASLDERNARARELELEVEGVERRTEEHRHVRQRHALLAELEHALADEEALQPLVRSRDERREGPTRPAGEEPFREALARGPDDR